MKVNVKKLNPCAKMPVFSSSAAAGADLCAILDEDLAIAPGDTALVHTGLAMEIPEGFVGLIYARSGLASKRGLAPANKVGVIDADYRGELMVSLHNHSKETQTIVNGERIAQLVISQVPAIEYNEVTELSDTVRGAGGFGSTGR